MSWTQKIEGTLYPPTRTYLTRVVTYSPDPLGKESSVAQEWEQFPPEEEGPVGIISSMKNLDKV